MGGKVLIDLDVIPKAKIEGETYEKDGIIYCKICNKPKTKIMKIFGSTRTVSCMCDCEKAAEEKRQAEYEAEETKRHIERLKINGIQDKQSSRHTFENDDNSNPDMKNMFMKYCKNWRNIYRNNQGLLLWGDVGNGKTFYAHAIGNYLLEKCVPVMMTDFLKVLNKIQGFDIDKNNFFHEMNEFKLLVIDDFGAERSTDFALEQVYNVIDQRYKSDQPIIITTNLTLDEMQNMENIRYKRICDRILEMCTPIEFSGESKRKKKGREKFEQLMKILGD